MVAPDDKPPKRIESSRDSPEEPVEGGFGHLVGTSPGRAGTH